VRPRLAPRPLTRLLGLALGEVRPELQSIGAGCSPKTSRTAGFGGPPTIATEDGRQAMTIVLMPSPIAAATAPRGGAAPDDARG
jgi:hypothetical protein